MKKKIEVFKLNNSMSNQNLNKLSRFKRVIKKFET